MAKIVFKELTSNQNVLFPVSLSEKIAPNHPVRVVNSVVDALDISCLLWAYKGGGTSSYHPRMMLKVLFYAYLNNIYSCRKIEKALQENIHFMWLSGNSTPDFRTINDFRGKRLKEHIKSLFSAIVLLLQESGYVSLDVQYIDGTKVESASNRYTFVWRGSVEKNKVKLESKIQSILSEVDKHIEQDKQERTPDCLPDMDSCGLREKVSALNKRLSGMNNAEQKQIKKLQEEYLPRLAKYESQLEKLGDRNSFSKTDEDATFMRMKEDHMKNGQLKPAYNVQIGVEGEYIVGIDISSERSDQLTFIPFLDKLEKNLNKKYKSITADAGYESEENYTYLENNNQKAFIKPQTYEKSKTKKFKNDISKRENMHYNQEDDYYICAAGKKLLPKGFTTRKSKSNFKSIVNIYECESCLGCEYKNKCTKAKNNRQLHVPKEFLRLRSESLANITTKEGIRLRINRSIQVEGAFAVIKQDYGFRRFLMRGNKKVRIELLIMAFAYNVNKLHNKTLQGRNGELLHEPKGA